MIPLMKQAFYEEFETRSLLADFIRRADRLSMDAKCAEFERAFAAFQGRKEAILFNSGGSANLALLQALCNLGTLKRDDAVGFSGLTWSTNVMPIIQMGMEPVPVDCTINTLNVMAANLDALPEGRIQALFITNALGFAGDLPALRRLCDSRNILLLEDNCEALGTELLPAGKTGNFGLASTFSFFVAHHMSTIEGGMICTDSEELAEMLRIVRANGWDRNLTARQQQKWRRKFGIKSEFQAKYSFYDLGFNLRPTEITGFLGLTQLKHLPKAIELRLKNHMRLESVSLSNPDFLPLDRAHIKTLSPFAFPVVCRTPQLRDQYLAQFSGAGIEVRPIIAGDIQQQPFFRKYQPRRFDLPGCQHLDRCGFYCGNYPELSDHELEVIASAMLPP